MHHNFNALEVFVFASHWNRNQYRPVSFGDIFLTQTKGFRCTKRGSHTAIMTTLALLQGWSHTLLKIIKKRCSSTISVMLITSAVELVTRRILHDNTNILDTNRWVINNETFGSCDKLQAHLFGTYKLPWSVLANVPYSPGIEALKKNHCYALIRPCESRKQQDLIPGQWVLRQKSALPALSETKSLSFSPPACSLLQPVMMAVGRFFTAATTSPAPWLLSSTATAPHQESPWYCR